MENVQEDHLRDGAKNSEKESQKMLWERPVLLELNPSHSLTGTFSANIEGTFSDPAFDTPS